MPIFRHDSPYYAPLSSSPWYLYAGTLAAVFRIFRLVALLDCVSTSIYDRIDELWQTYLRRVSRGMEKSFEETALKAPSGIDGRALMWTYESLDEDHELEQFFAGIPGFCSSKLVDNPQSCLEDLRDWTAALALNELLERTWSSNLVTETIKQRRLVTCVRAIDAAYLDNAAKFILNNFFSNRPALLRSVKLGHSLIGRGNHDNGITGLFSQVIISSIITNVPQPNERWFSLTMHYLGISDDVLRSYLDHGNSVLLAVLIHFTRHFVHNSPEDRWLMLSLSRYGLETLHFDVKNTLPDLQHDFCDLWNEIVLRRREARFRPDFTISNILRHVYTIYDALHRGSTLNNEYPLCSIPAHRIRSTSTLIKVDCDRQAETASAPITTPPFYHHGPVPSIIPLVTKCDTPLSLTSNLDYTIPHLVDEQSRNGIADNVTPAASSFRLAPLDNDRISGYAAADSIQRTTVPSAISYMANTGFRSTSSHGTATRHTRNDGI